MDVVFLVHTTQDNAHRSEAVKQALEHLVSALGPLGPQAVQVFSQPFRRLQIASLAG